MIDLIGMFKHRIRTKTTTIDLNQAAGTYTLFTGVTQDVIAESLVINMPNHAAGGALTGITIQTDDATPQVFIGAAQGLVANLTAEAQLAWTGAIRLIAGKLIRLTIVGGAEGAAHVCGVVISYRAIASGGYVA